MIGFVSLAFTNFRNRSWNSLGMALLGLASLPALSGCAALQVKMGTKVYLAKLSVSSIEVSQPKGAGIGPGQKSPLVVTVTQPDGKVLTTEGAGNGKVLWEDLKVESTVVAVSKKGVVSLLEDPRVSDGKLPHLVITAPSHPDLRAELDIPLRYDYRYSAYFSGSSGSSGMNGTSGLDGSNGSVGSMDPNHPSAGGNGTDGARSAASTRMPEATLGIATARPPTTVMSPKNSSCPPSGELSSDTLCVVASLTTNSKDSLTASKARSRLKGAMLGRNGS